MGGTSLVKSEDIGRALIKYKVFYLPVTFPEDIEKMKQNQAV